MSNSSLDDRLNRAAAVLRRVLADDRRVELGSGELLIDGVPYRFENGVLRLRRGDGYNASFALQWKRFRLNQYDHVNGTRLTADRFARGTGWPLQGLEGEIILEAGCGAGRFTRILAETGATIVACDYSSAVDVSAEVNGRFENVIFLQADILDLPFRSGSFDRVFCHGVLQHTADPARAFRALRAALRPGGSLSVDIYHKDGRIRPWKSKYLWRPLTTRMRPERLLTVLEWFVPRWLPFDTWVKRIPYLGVYLGSVVPCWNYQHTPLSAEQKRLWAIMDTFDALSPRFDKPATRGVLEGWFRDGGFAGYEVREGGNGLLGNGIAA
jgi:SAM-dependent methyltransferase